jgi:PAS domain S-box-containing protein
MFELSPDAILLADVTGRYVDTNTKALALLGYSREELLRLSARDIVAASPGWVEAEFERFVRDGHWEGEVEMRARNGTLVPLEARAVVLPGANGPLYVSYLRDRSADKHNELTRARLAAIVRSSADAIVGETAEGIITDWNPAAERLYGYAADEAIGQSLTLLAPPERRAEVEALLARVVGGESIEHLETVRRTRSGRLLPVALTLSPVRDDRGEVIAASAIVRDISLQVENARALEESEARFRTAFDNAPIGMAVTGADGRPLQVNRAMCAILGYSEHELLTRTVWDFTHPEDVLANQEVMRRALAGEIDGYNLEKRYLRKDGRAIWVLLSASLVRDEEGAPRYFIAQIQDITERRRLEEDLRASETRYRTLIEQIPAVVYVLAADENQTPLYYTPYIEKMLGVKPEEAAAFKEHWLDVVVHPDDRDRIAAEEARTGPFGLHFTAEYRHRRADGSYVWVHDECVPIRDDTGEIVAWQGVMFDISERVKAEEALARLAAIVESADDAILSRTLDGFITSWNASAERLFGYTAAEMIGNSFTVLLPEDQLPASPAEILASGSQSAQFETKRRRKDGQLIDVALSLSPIRDARGEVVGVSTITRDITARKRMEADLRAALDAAQAAQRATSQFLGMMSHELRTPMQAVLGYADLLLAGAESSLSDEQREDVRYIKSGATRMMRLVEQMLSLSRLEAGRLEVNLEPVELATVCEQVRQEIAPLAAPKGLALVIALPPDLPLVMADVWFLHQILLNLVENAVKFTERGEVRITARVTGQGFEIAVTDTGIGIAAEALPHIFDEFWQADGGLTRRYGGAGLGLAITRRLVELHGGSLEVASQLWSGSTFTVCLPADAILSPEGANNAASSVRR